ncbi:hypothetical protein [Natranaerobius trueperi]|uniref:Uncharacterized protein n=1 Tax=Natranaerobius trueperi TaxID=759412 RepID=A0A226C0J3_9FIRM|nr:hypothetical protein [Natranaerobius trueperi]OWZ84114.1 hypothetical protein CDO51_05205 [Natranaerobius trueperi]
MKNLIIQISFATICFIYLLPYMFTEVPEVIDLILSNFIRIIGVGILLLSIILYLFQDEKIKIRSTIKKTIANINLGIKEKEEVKYPKITECKKENQHYHVKIKLLPGICGEDFIKKKQYFDSALKTKTDIYEKNGCVHMQFPK